MSNLRAGRSRESGALPRTAADRGTEGDDCLRKAKPTTLSLCLGVGYVSTHIREASPADTYRVYQLLSGSTLNNRSLSLAARRRLHNSRWSGDQAHHGYLLEDDGKVVGFLGTLFTTRTIGNVDSRFCEIHSWYVEDAYRNNGISLFLPVLALRNTHTILNYTPTKGVYEIGKKFGFSDLETEILLLYPIPMSVRRLHITDRKWQVAEHLAGTDLGIFEDHIDVPCHHLVVLDPSRSAPPLYLLMKSMRRRWYEPFGRLLYASDFSRFAEVADALCWRLSLRFGWQCIAVDAARFDAHKPTGLSRKIKREIPSQYFSKLIDRKSLYPLYSQPLLQGYPLH